MINNPQTVIPDENSVGAQLNLGAGVDFTLARDLALVTEFGYHITDGSSLDGTIVPGEVNAQDSYLAFTIGVNFIFGKGEASELCVKCNQRDGMSAAEKDRLIYNSKVVDRYILSLANDKLVLVGVNFAFDESVLLPESYAVLDKTVKLMKDKPEIKVQISGYTDYVGTDDYNINLSMERANTVRKYLVSKGISEKRLSTVSQGQSGSLYDNKTGEGREMNRKVMLKIIK
ncbi:MAG: OmpA family protein [Spirochaetia bacterium]|nr:OmpA family protein [Spirochaetia bacterium]